MHVMTNHGCPPAISSFVPALGSQIKNMQVHHSQVHREKEIDRARSKKVHWINLFEKSQTQLKEWCRHQNMGRLVNFGSLSRWTSQWCGLSARLGSLAALLGGSNKLPGCPWWTGEQWIATTFTRQVKRSMHMPCRCVTVNSNQLFFRVGLAKLAITNHRSPPVNHLQKTYIYKAHRWSSRNLRGPTEWVQHRLGHEPSHAGYVAEDAKYH